MLQNVKFKFQPSAMFPFFVFSRKSCLIKFFLSSEDLSEYKISWSYFNLYNYYIHLKSLNVRHFGMDAATILKLWRRGHVQWYDFSTEFHKSLPTGSEVNAGG
jgi:hypothetical protein